MKYTLKTHRKKILADTITPVSVYLRLRDKFPNSLLLESSDYRANDNTFSYICCKPIASITVKNEVITEVFPDGTTTTTSIEGDTDVVGIIEGFAKKFETEDNEQKFIQNGLFGYMSYDAVRYFEDIEVTLERGDWNKRTVSRRFSNRSRHCRRYWGGNRLYLFHRDSQPSQSCRCQGETIFDQI